MKEEFSKNFSIGEKIELPFFNGTIMPSSEVDINPNNTYYFSFSNFDSVVKNFLKINVVPVTKGFLCFKIKSYR